MMDQVIKVFMGVAWIAAITLVTTCIIMIAERRCAKNANAFASDGNHMRRDSYMNLVAVQKENDVIEAIFDFYNEGVGYCDARLCDRKMLQDLYNELVSVSKTRKDGNFAIPRDILSYRLDTPQARNELIEKLMNYLVMRREKNGYLLQHQKALIHYK